MLIGKIIETGLDKKLEDSTNYIHPMEGRRCIIRTYSAGVHFGLVKKVYGDMHVHLVDSCRLWKWEGGGLSLSAVNIEGMKGGRINITGEIFIQAIEFIPTTEAFENSWRQYVE